LRWAAIKGIYNGKSHETFKPKFKKVESKEIIYLTWDELIKLYQFKFKKNQNYLEKVRDVFCFCCFTGLRHSDVYKLTRSDVSNEHISVVTQKTSDTLKIEFNNFSKAILNKYENELMPDNKALPVISNQKTNDYLKEIGSLLEFNDSVRMVYFIGSVRHEKVYKKWELLTSHCGRRTFVVNALSLGIPAEVIIKWTGHSDYKSMKPYISIVDTLKRKEMNKFNLVPSL
jgi:integrase